MTGLITADAIKFSFVVGPVYAVGVWFGASLFGRASEAVFRAICYALIAAAVLIGLPALDDAALAIVARSPTLVQHQIAIRITIALDALAGVDREPVREHRSRHHAGVKLAILAAGIDASGRSASNCASNLRPANSAGSFFRSTVARYASSPLAIIACASSGVGRSHNGNTGVMPVPASFCSR